MKIQIKGFVHASKSWDGEISYDFFSCDMTGYGHMLVGEQVIEVDVPDNFNPVAAEIEELNAQKKKRLDEYTRDIRAINEKIANLQCIEFNPTEVAS